MPAELNVINTTAPPAPVDITRGNGTVLKTIPAGQAAAVGAEALLTVSFADQLIRGRLQLGKTPMNQLDPAQVVLSQMVIAHLINHAGRPALQADQQALRSQERLETLRVVYNIQHNRARELALTLKAMANGTAHLASVAKHFINTDAEDAAVNAAQQAVDDKKQEDIQATNKTLAVWDAEHDVLLATLADAQRRQRVARANYDRLFKDSFSALTDAAGRMASVDEDKIVGVAVPAFPLP